MNASCPSFSTRLAVIIDTLCRAVAAGLGRGLMTAAVIVMVWQRIRRTETLLRGLIERMHDGRIRSAPERTAGVRTLAAGPRLGDAASARPVLPRRFGWLLQLVPCEAANLAGQLRVVLAEPDMIALLAESRQAVRILRPLCWMLGIKSVASAPCLTVRPMAARSGEADGLTFDTATTCGPGLGTIPAEAREAIAVDAVQSNRSGLERRRPGLG